MDNILDQILNFFNTGIGFTGTAITLYDHFKNRNITHITETFTAIRNKSKEAFDSYCEYREHRKNDIGTPLKEDILGYWESCLERDILPSVTDMVSLRIATKEEAEIMLAYLLKSWMEVPDFVEWLHDILTQNKLEELSKTLLSLQENLRGVSEFADELRQQDIRNIAFIITPERIIDAKCSCTDLDIKRYYMVDNRFNTMFKVISAGHDIPHSDASQKALALVEERHPVIIAGNGGLGKTSLMMRTAIQWASCGRVAIWLSLSNKDVITKQKAAALFNHLTAMIPVGQRALLCIDNPYEGKSSFVNLQETCPDNDKIQLIMAERANRLTLLAGPDQDFLLYWFDNAQIITLQGLKLSTIFELKDYTSWQFLETQARRKKILMKCTRPLVEEGIVKEKDRSNIIQMILNCYAKPNVSLVELIYRTLFELKKKASKPESIKLDWEEWESFIESEFGKGESYSRKELYGVIAALKVFHTPITISLFCKHFKLDEWKLRNHLNERLMSQHIEPVIFQNDTLQPKHDVIAELFFLFHGKTVSINSIMLHLLQCMDENEIESLLSNMVIKKEFRDGHKYQVGQINYRDYMDAIYNRILNHSCNLSETGRAYLCLGYLWSRFQQNTSGNSLPLNDILNEITPEIDDSLIMAKLYTKWGIWARSSGDNALAEEKYRLVIENYPQTLPTRTELGKLLAKQSGREKEAEALFREVLKMDPENIMARTELGILFAKQSGRRKEAEALFRKVMQIKPNDIQSRTELGKLLAIQPGREKEAETILRKAMQINPRHIQSRTELGRLLAKQSGREKEAEAVLREAVTIDPQNLYPHTELGRLLAKQPGREKETETFLRKAIKISPRNLHPRTVLAELYEKQNRYTEAVKLYQEICKYNPGDRYGERGLERLKNYIKK